MMCVLSTTNSAQLLVRIKHVRCFDKSYTTIKCVVSETISVRFLRPAEIAGRYTDLIM